MAIYNKIKKERRYYRWLRVQYRYSGISNLDNSIIYLKLPMYVKYRHFLHRLHKFKL